MVLKEKGMKKRVEKRLLIEKDYFPERASESSRQARNDRMARVHRSAFSIWRVRASRSRG
jgi:hypothetical protein